MLTCSEIPVPPVRDPSTIAAQFEVVSLIRVLILDSNCA